MLVITPGDGSVVMGQGVRLGHPWDLLSAAECVQVHLRTVVSFQQAVGLVGQPGGAVRLSGLALILSFPKSPDF